MIEHYLEALDLRARRRRHPRCACGGGSSPSPRTICARTTARSSASERRPRSRTPSPPSWEPARPAGPQSERSPRSASREPSTPSRSSAPRSPGTRRPTRGRSLAALAFAAVIVAPQVSFVAGSLALVRVLRRREPVLPSAELTVINRRTGVALVFGLVTMVALELLAFELRNDSAGWWVALTLAGAAVATPLLVLAALPAAVAARLRPRVAGASGRPVRRPRLRAHGPVALRPPGRVRRSGSSSGSPRPSRAIRSTARSAEPPRRSRASRASRCSAAILGLRR